MARQLIDSLSSDFEPEQVPRRVPRPRARHDRAQGAGRGDRGRGAGGGAEEGARPDGRARGLDRPRASASRSPSRRPRRSRSRRRPRPLQRSRCRPRPSRSRSRAGSCASPTSTRSCTPAAGFTKGEVIDYYTRAAPALLPHLRGRPLTLKRYPNGVEGGYFYEKRCPSHAPEWVRSAPIRAGDRLIDFVLCDDLPTLVWLANLADLELHPSLSLADEIERPTVMAFDLDPGPARRPGRVLRGGGAAARHARAHRSSASRRPRARRACRSTCRSTPASTYDDTKPFAKALARHLEAEHPKLVVSSMKKELRRGQGVHRLEPERRAQDHGGRLLAARAGAPDGVHAARLGRARGGRSRLARLRGGRRSGADRGAWRPVRAGARAGRVWAVDVCSHLAVNGHRTASTMRSPGRGAGGAGAGRRSLPVWLARSAYYYDSAGNIIELIARERVPGDELLIEVSEVGLPVADVGAAVDFLETELGVPHFSGDQNFSAVGDDHGLFILVPGRAAWLSRTGPPATRRCA